VDEKYIKNFFLIVILGFACCCWGYVFLYIYKYDTHRGFGFRGPDDLIYGLGIIYVKKFAIPLLFDTIILLRLFGSGYLSFHKIELTVVLGVIIFAISATIWTNRYTMEFCHDNMGNQLIVLLITYFLFGYLSLDRSPKNV